MSAPRVGQFLYASCSGADYGKVLAVGADANGTPTINIELNDPNNLAIIEWDMTNPPEDWPNPPNTHVEIPPGVKIILRGVQYRNVKDHGDGWVTIECNTPGNGCYRCTKMFVLLDEPAS